MLRIKNLHAYYDQIEALKDVNMQVDEGQMVCLIGSNGAGKTTLLNSISRMVKTTGTIELDDVNIMDYTPTKVAQLGIMHVPSGRHIFPGLTVKENLEIGTVNWRGPFGRGDYSKDINNVYEIFPRLEERKEQLGYSLSGGEQQMLAIGRAIMGRPNILLLDEPSMGLAPIIVEELFEQIVEINKSGITIFLVEQNAKIAFSVSEYAYVIEGGEVKMEGKPADIKDDPRIVQAYLGKHAVK